MFKFLYMYLAQSDKNMQDMSESINCTIEELVDKIEGRNKFTGDEIKCIADYFDIKNPIHIFFDL